jgi:hypothetical protein
MSARHSRVARQRATTPSSVRFCRCRLVTGVPRAEESRNGTYDCRQAFRFCDDRGVWPKPLYDSKLNFFLPHIKQNSNASSQKRVCNPAGSAQILRCQPKDSPIKLIIGDWCNPCTRPAQGGLDRQLDDRIAVEDSYTESQQLAPQRPAVSYRLVHCTRSASGSVLSIWKP